MTSTKKIPRSKSPSPSQINLPSPSQINLPSKSPSNTSFNLDPYIYILPCLQELRVAIESEQEGSIINNKGINSRIAYLSFSSNSYNKVWGKDEEQRKDNKWNFLQKHKDARQSLKIPYFEGFKTCKNIKTCSGKWALLFDWLFDKSPLKIKGGTLLLVSHHNRMKDNTGQGLFPIKKGSNCNAYANNVCLRIEIKNSNIVSIKVAFGGFPDKGDLIEKCKDDFQGGGKQYNYCCKIEDDNIEDDNIDTSCIKEGLAAYLHNHKIQNVVIYLVRHGNSLHNAPINKSLALDSCLTYLGMYQAKLLGEYLKKHYIEDFKNPIVLGTSFLARTQLTGLCILKSIGGLDNKNNTALKYDYNLLKINALSRAKKLNITYKKFLKIAPLNTTDEGGKFKDFCEELDKSTHLKGGNKTRKNKSKKRIFRKRKTRKRKSKNL